MFSDFHTNPFYKPLWRRVAIVASTIVWTAFEYFVGHGALWLGMAVATAAYCIWQFLISYPDQQGS